MVGNIFVPFSSEPSQMARLQCRAKMCKNSTLRIWYINVTDDRQKTVIAVPTAKCNTVTFSKKPNIGPPSKLRLYSFSFVSYGMFSKRNSCQLTTSPIYHISSITSVPYMLAGLDPQHPVETGQTYKAWCLLVPEHYCYLRYIRSMQQLTASC